MVGTSQDISMRVPISSVNDDPSSLCKCFFQTTKALLVNIYHSAGKLYGSGRERKLEVRFGSEFDCFPDSGLGRLNRSCISG